jgi:hypothetical protein
MFMPKRPVSLTLEDSNLVWLRGVTARSGGRSLSETVDRLITSAREAGGAAAAASRSVAGTIDISASDAALDGADVAITALFAQSLSRPMLVADARASFTRKRPRRG